MDDLFARAAKLPWVTKVQPAAPSSSNGWGKRAHDYHLSSPDKDYCIEIYVNGKLATSWKWDQREVSAKSVKDERWQTFLDGAAKEFPALAPKPAVEVAKVE